MTIWVGAGLAGLIVLVGGEFGTGILVLDQLSGEAPPGLKSFPRSLLLTLVLGAGGALALARVGFEWGATQLERELEDTKLVEGQRLPKRLNRAHGRAEFWWDWSRRLMITAALILLGAAWLPLVITIWNEISSSWPPIVVAAVLIFVCLVSSLDLTWLITPPKKPQDIPGHSRKTMAQEMPKTA
jgi:drug/metabolite transporter (DMT)-like permease